jgi:hypothetical protein
MIVAQKGVSWALTNRTHVDATTTVDVYLGTDWRDPPYDASKGAVLRLTLARSACVVHAPDLSITVGEVVAALKVATKATMGDAPEGTDPNEFDLDSLDMDRYDRVAFDSSVLANTMPLSTVVKQKVYRIANPMMLRMLLRT